MQHDATAPSQDRSIDILGLRHTYAGGHTALDGVDLTFGTGVFGLLGPNGAGKSTLMRIVCTLLAPSEGRVNVCGYDVRRDQQAIRGLIGYLPQQFGAWRLHRVEEVLDTLARLSGMSDSKRRRARVAEVLDQVGLSEVAHRKVKKLSGGMVRRLGVAQALVHEPRVLVVDEPTVGLDPQERIRFRQLMSGLGRDRTILLSTHIVADLGAGCRELALLDAGRVVFHGSPSELLGRAAGRVFEVTVPLADAGVHRESPRDRLEHRVQRQGDAARRDGRWADPAVGDDGGGTQPGRGLSGVHGGARTDLGRAAGRRGAASANREGGSLMRLSMILAVARAEIRSVRRLARYWVFAILSVFITFAIYMYYGAIHGFLSRMSATIGAIGPRYLVPAMGIYVMAIFLLGFDLPGLRHQGARRARADGRSAGLAPAFPTPSCWWAAASASC